MSTSLLLFCDALHSRFTLAREGEDWRQTFDSFAEAYKHAEKCASGTTLLVLYNERGAAILETAIAPSPRHSATGFAPACKQSVL